MEPLWITGKAACIGGQWALVGIFPTRYLAVKACRVKDDFVALVPVNVYEPDGSCIMGAKEYPLAKPAKKTTKRKPEALKRCGDE